MTNLLASCILAVIAGILCFIVEKMDSIPFHIDHHHEPLLAALTGAATTFFASFILMEITKLTM